MADIQNLVDTALYSVLSGGTALTAIAATIWQEIAAPNAQKPYVVYRHVLGTNDDCVGHDTDIFEYDIGVVDDARYPDRAGSARAEIRALLHNKPLSISGKTNSAIYRTATFRFQDEDGFWYVGDTYRIRVEA